MLIHTVAIGRHDHDLAQGERDALPNLVRRVYDRVPPRFLEKRIGRVSSRGECRNRGVHTWHRQRRGHGKLLIQKISETALLNLTNQIGRRAERGLVKETRGLRRGGPRCRSRCRGRRWSRSRCCARRRSWNRSRARRWSRARSWSRPWFFVLFRKRSVAEETN